MISTKLITIGDELLIGQVVDTNSAWIGQHLNEIGISINKIVSIKDNEADILKELDDPKMDIILVTGGLGPTNDDITKTTVAKFFNTELVFDQKYYNDLEVFLDLMGLKMNHLNKDQAMVPKGCNVIPNTKGTAPGMHLIKEKQHFFFMPGVPMEMKNMMSSHILSYLKEQFDLKTVYHQTVRTTGVPESELAIELKEWEDSLSDNIALAYLPNYEGVRLRMSCYASDKETIDNINTQVGYLKNKYPQFVYGDGDQSLVEEVSNLLKDRKETLSTSESCTGGYIGHQLTTIPGASEFYKGGIIAYDNEVKMSELSVAASHLFEHGAVSKQVVLQMARGIREKLDTNYAIATSGIAGPSGGSKEKPVGTVWIAVASKTRVVARCFQFGQGRERIVRKATITALNILRTEFLK